MIHLATQLACAEFLLLLQQANLCKKQKRQEFERGFNRKNVSLEELGDKPKLRVLKSKCLTFIVVATQQMHAFTMLSIPQYLHIKHSTVNMEIIGTGGKPLDRNPSRLVGSR